MRELVLCPIPKRKEDGKWGISRTKAVVFQIYDALQEAIHTGQPHRIRVDPAPTDARCCHLQRRIET